MNKTNKEININKDNKEPLLFSFYLSHIGDQFNCHGFWSSARSLVWALVTEPIL